jgi:dTDP-4-amino-4,6-dideoxygalactose transaminase
VAAIQRAGAIPVLVDIDESTYTMDPDSLERMLHDLPTGVTARAVMPVHLYGTMSDMPAISAIARSAGLVVIEDCAQAHGAELDGRKAGTFGDAAAFSFYPTKNLGALGDGGAVVTDRADVNESVRELREYGWRTRYVSDRHGSNSRLDELQAAVLSTALAHLDEDNERRRGIADVYRRGLAGSELRLPQSAPGASHVFHQYVVRSTGRERLRAACERQRIGTAIHYPVPVHLQPAYRDGSIVAGPLPVTERIAAEVMSLPMFPQLGSRAAGRVVSCLIGELAPT